MTLPELAGYKINNALASGGMAKIYDAVQVSLDRPVAIKFLSTDLLAHPEAYALFEQESLIIAQLNHPNIVQIYDKGISEDSRPFFVMEKINGVDLSVMLKGGELPLNKKFDIAIQICKGLAYAHKNGVIHRDIKPSNIIIDQHSDAKILDFGIAIAGDSDSDPQQPSSVVGTMGYVAPEQQENYDQATIVSDIYSVGVLFFDLFGRPRENGNPTALTRLEDIQSDDLKKLIKKCSHVNPAERFQSLNDVRDELLRISQGSHLGQTNLKSVTNETRDLSANFNLLDVLGKSKNKRVFLFQKKSTKQLLVIRRTVGDASGLKEAKILTSLKHASIVNVYAAVGSGDKATIISEYLSGGSLASQLIQEFSEEKFLDISIKLSSALDFAHQNNLQHGNLLPNNILFDDKQIPKICDFGVNYTANEKPELAKAYLPPGRQKKSIQFDIYCLGAIFHHMLYGVAPNVPVPATSSRISFRLQKLIDHMLAIDPQNRIQSAQEVFVELNRIANANSSKLRRSRIGEDLSEKQAVTKKAPQTKKNRSVDWVFILSLALIFETGVILLLLLLLKIK